MVSTAAIDPFYQCGFYIIGNLNYFTMRYYIRFLISLLPVLLFLTNAAVSQQVWFAPPDNLPRGTRIINHDFPHLFDDSPGWSARTNIFVLAPHYVEAASEDSLRRIAAFLKQHAIALAVGIGSVQMDNAQRTQGECGFGVEGYTRPNKNHIIFSRLKRFGLDVKYIEMDEPLTYGHYMQKGNACRFSIVEVARRVAATIAEIKAIYPDAKVVDAEAPTIASPAQWAADLGVWLTAFRSVSAAPVDAVVYDLDWRQPWLQWVRPSIGVLHSQGVQVGLFLDGTGPGVSDAASIVAYKSNIQAVEDSRLSLDLVIIANWTIHPSRNLPESDPESLSSVLKWYIDRHPLGSLNKPQDPLPN
jgi:hypothetical protein